MSWCSPVIIAHLDALIWLNGIFWWLYHHGGVAAPFSSHLSDSISGAASWRTPDWRLQADSWKQASWGGGEGSRDAGSFIGSVWVCAGSLDYLPIQRFPIPFYFFSLPYWRLSWQYWTVSMEKGWGRATLLLFTGVTPRSKTSILTPYLVGWNEKINFLFNYMVFQSA